MFTKTELCERIISLYPDIGACGIDVDVTYDEDQKAWVVHLKKDSHSLNHFLEMMDAKSCMDGTQCVALGLEIAQMKNNIQGKQY